MPLTITNVLSTVVHSANSEMTTVQTQCGYARTQCVESWNMLDRVSALIIRWCRVRLTGGPPKTHYVATISNVDVQQNTVLHSFWSVQNSKRRFNTVLEKVKCYV
jgi:hypothetical protein